MSPRSLCRSGSETESRGWVAPMCGARGWQHSLLEPVICTGQRDQGVSEGLTSIPRNMPPMKCHTVLQRKRCHRQGSVLHGRTVQQQTAE